MEELTVCPQPLGTCKEAQEALGPFPSPPREQVPRVTLSKGSSSAFVQTHPSRILPSQK